MTPGTSSRFLLVATRAPDRRMQSDSAYAYYKPSPWTSLKTSSARSARSEHPSAIAFVKGHETWRSCRSSPTRFENGHQSQDSSVNLIVPRGLLVAADEAIE
jgi:hypothetical protein